MTKKTRKAHIRKEHTSHYWCGSKKEGLRREARVIAETTVGEATIMNEEGKGNPIEKKTRHVLDLESYDIEIIAAFNEYLGKRFPKNKKTLYVRVYEDAKSYIEDKIGMVIPWSFFAGYREILECELDRQFGNKDRCFFDHRDEGLMESDIDIVLGKDAGDSTLTKITYHYGDLNPPFIEHDEEKRTIIITTYGNFERDHLNFLAKTISEKLGSLFVLSDGE